MRSVSIAVIVLMAAPHGAASQSATVTCDTNATARALCSAETALTEALRHNDVSGLSQIYDDEFRLIKSGALRFESLTTSQVELSLHGNLGIVTGVQNQVAREPGSDSAAHPNMVRFTHVHVLRDGRWRLVSSQITPILQ